MAANDTEFIKSIFFEEEFVHHGLTAQGKQWDRELVKNQAKIRALNAEIEKYTEQMKALETSGKNPKKIAEEKAKLQAKIDAAKAKKEVLIQRDHELAVLIAQDQDLGLRAERSSHAKWEKILAKEKGRFNQVNGLTYTIGGVTAPISTFDFKRSDTDLAEYKRQLEAMLKDKKNSHIKDVLKQQIEFCEMVQLYRREARGLSDRETARLTHLSTIFSPTSKSPIVDWNSKVGALISQTGIGLINTKATTIQAKATEISASLAFGDPSRTEFETLRLKAEKGELTPAQERRFTELARDIETLDPSSGGLKATEKASLEMKNPKAKDLFELKTLLNKKPSQLTPAEKARLVVLKAAYPTFKKDSSVLEVIAQDEIAMGKAAYMQSVAEAGIDPTRYPGKTIADLLTPPGLTIEQLAELAKDPNLGGTGITPEVRAGLRKVITDQMEYQEYKYLSEAQSRGLTKKEEARLAELRKRYKSSRSPVSSFLDQSTEYSAEIEEYLERSRKFMEEREARARQSVATAEFIEGGDKDNGIESAIEGGLATYNATDEAYMNGGNIQNKGDKRPVVELTEKKDTAEYEDDGTAHDPLAEDAADVTKARRKKRTDSTSDYRSDGRRSDGLGR